MLEAGSLIECGKAVLESTDDRRWPPDRVQFSAEEPGDGLG